MQGPELINQEIDNVHKGDHSPGSLKGKSISKQLCSSSKKGWGSRSAIDLKTLSSSIPYFRFRKFWKITILCARLIWKMSTFASLCRGIIKGVLCLYFGLGPAPRILTKLKIPIAKFRRIQIRITIYLDDTCQSLLMRQAKNYLEIARDTLIFLLQSLGFQICRNFFSCPSKR